MMKKDVNSFQDETSYLNQSPANAKRLQEAIAEMNSGISYSYKLLDGDIELSKAKKKQILD